MLLFSLQIDITSALDASLSFSRRRLYAKHGKVAMPNKGAEETVEMQR